MEKIVLLTATYNHCKLLGTIYKSLLSQTNKDFLWCIVDDGSTDSTENVVNTFVKEKKINIHYIKKNNGGKSSAINMGLDLIQNDQMVVIIDDDESLYDNAVNTLYEYYSKYFQSQNIGCINFQRTNKATGKYFANYNVVSDIKCDYWSFKSSGKSMDGYIAYFGYSIKDFRFPKYNKEKYVGPSVLIMLVNQQYQMIWAKDGLGASEYLENGISQQGRKLRLRNPIGMVECCVLNQDKKESLKLRLKYSTQGFAYLNKSGMSRKEIQSLGVNTKKLIGFTKPFGILLGVYWRNKYK